MHHNTWLQSIQSEREVAHACNPNTRSAGGGWGTAMRSRTWLKKQYYTNKCTTTTTKYCKVVVNATASCLRSDSELFERLILSTQVPACVTALETREAARTSLQGRPLRAPPALGCRLLPCQPLVNRFISPKHCPDSNHPLQQAGLKLWAKVW
jgi:hypothetical protein